MNLRKLSNREWDRPGLSSMDDKNAASSVPKWSPLPKTYKGWLAQKPQEDRRPFLVRLLTSIKVRLKLRRFERGGKPGVKVDEVGVSGGAEF